MPKNAVSKTTIAECDTLLLLQSICCSSLNRFKRMKAALAWFRSPQNAKRKTQRGAKIAHRNSDKGILLKCAESFVLH